MSKFDSLPEEVKELWKNTRPTKEVLPELEKAAKELESDEIYKAMKKRAGLIDAEDDLLDFKMELFENKQKYILESSKFKEEILEEKTVTLLKEKGR